MTIHKDKNQEGFTLLEALLYSALFAFIMTGLLASAYMIIQATENSGGQLLVDDEASFIIRKMDWAMTGINTIHFPNEDQTGFTLSINKQGVGLVQFRLNSGDIEIDTGSGYFPLDSENVTATDLTFYRIPASGEKPSGIKVEFYLNDVHYTTTKYVRK
jgi:type II secretory pathway pseudopilin PulG